MFADGWKHSALFVKCEFQGVAVLLLDDDSKDAPGIWASVKYLVEVVEGVTLHTSDGTVRSQDF
jgi:hypothetical protein